MIISRLSLFHILFFNQSSDVSVSARPSIGTPPAENRLDRVSERESLMAVFVFRGQLNTIFLSPLNPAFMGLTTAENPYLVY